jgi:beta-glucanase (GH16 family)
VSRVAILAVVVAACAPGTPPIENPQPADAAGTGKDAAPPADAGAILGAPWHLVWQDEFEGDGGTRPDPSKWSPDIGGDGWGNGQLEFDTDRTDNAALDGQGHLVITSKRENYSGNAYTSARLTTHGHLDRTYGRFEARMKLPRGQGMWPAFWLLGSNEGSVGWPDCGEIDVMENRGQQPTIIRGSLHGPGYSGGANHGRETDIGADVSKDFHTYIIEWDPDRVVWKVDEKVYFTSTPADLPAGKQWVYDHPFFVIVNAAVGGNYVGSPNGSTAFPQATLIDYVRVYERIPQ